MARNSGRFHFDGGAATYVGTGILAVLITVCTLGICYPFALVLKERWRAKHSYVDGKWEHTDFDPTWHPDTLPAPGQPTGQQALV